jgi:hypothetical protein
VSASCYSHSSCYQIGEVRSSCNLKGFQCLRGDRRGQLPFLGSKTSPVAGGWNAPEAEPPTATGTRSRRNRNDGACPLRYLCENYVYCRNLQKPPCGYLVAASEKCWTTGLTAHSGLPWGRPFIVSGTCDSEANPVIEACITSEISTCQWVLSR